VGKEVSKKVSQKVSVNVFIRSVPDVSCTGQICGYRSFLSSILCLMFCMSVKLGCSQ
jgi:hypothetical protein